MCLHNVLDGIARFSTNPRPAHVSDKGPQRFVKLNWMIAFRIAAWGGRFHRETLTINGLTNNPSKRHKTGPF
jgi:hypothetical protein